MKRSLFSRRADSPEIEIEYEYRVNGVRHTGQTVRFSPVSSGHNELDLIDDNPVGSHIDVFFDPQEPEWSLLQPGLEGRDYLIPYGLLVLNLLALLLSRPLARRSARGFSGEKPVGSRPGMSGRKPTCESSTSIPFAALWATDIFAGISLLVLLGRSDASLSLTALVLVWTGVLVCGWLAWIGLRYLNQPRDADLVIDLRTRTVTLPRLPKQATNVTVSFDHLRSLTVESAAKSTAKGREIRTYYPALVLQSRADRHNMRT